MELVVHQLWCFLFMLFVQYIQSHSTLARIAAFAAGVFKYRHTQQLRCGDGEPKRGLRPSVRLVENQNSDVGRDLRPKLGMYTRAAMRLTLIMDSSHDNMDWAFFIFFTLCRL